MSHDVFEVTEVHFTPIRPRASLVGFASIVLNRALRLGAIGVHSRWGGGIRLVFPEKVLPNGATVEIACPITRPCGDLLTKAVATHLSALEAKILAGEPKTCPGGVGKDESPNVP